VASDVAGSPPRHVTGGWGRPLPFPRRPPSLLPLLSRRDPPRRRVPGAVCRSARVVCRSAARCVPSARRAGGSLCDVTGVRAAGFRVTAALRACEARGARAVQERPVSPVFLRAVRVWQHTAVRRPPATPTRPSLRAAVRRPPSAPARPLRAAVRRGTLLCAAAPNERSCVSPLATHCRSAPPRVASPRAAPQRPRRARRCASLRSLTGRGDVFFVQGCHVLGRRVHD
jgi:hypothetical protein